MTSMISRIRHSLVGIVDDFAALIREVPIRRLDRDGRVVVIIAPEFWYGDLSPEQKNRQIELVKQYSHFFELIQLLFSGSPPDVQKDIRDADSDVRKWLQLDSNWSITLDKGQNEASLREAFGEFEKLIAVLAAVPTNELLVVPDTNAILDHLAPIDYGQLVDTNVFSIILLPTVLAELDSLKTNHRNESVREKAKAAITSIKGWRLQGSLLSGVKVQKTITIRTIPTEPKATHFPSWLDHENSDDRIIASMLELSAENPTAALLLVTGDINLQNKAEFSSLEYADFDK